MRKALIVDQLIEDGVTMRLREAADLLSDGTSELTGKAIRAFNWENPQERDAFTGRVKGVKASIPYVADMPEPPKRIAAAIRRGKGKLYDRLRRSFRKDVVRHEGKTILEYVDLASPEELDDLIKRSVDHRRAVIAAHAGRGNCPHCHAKHSPSVHLSHGKGAFNRTHLPPELRDGDLW